MHKKDTDTGYDNWERMRHNFSTPGEEQISPLIQRDDTKDSKHLIGTAPTRFFSAQAQMLLSEILISQKLASPYQTKRCFKYYLGRELSFDKSFKVQFSIFSEIGFENLQISA